MKIYNPTPEQVTQIAARSTYLLSNIMAWVKMNQEWPSEDTENQIKSLWTVAEGFLNGIGAVEFESLKDMFTQLTIKTEKPNVGYKETIETY